MNNQNKLMLICILQELKTMKVLPNDILNSLHFKLSSHQNVVTAKSPEIMCDEYMKLFSVEFELLKGY